ncbi:MAG: phosphomethylpyrimidine synthase ThiC, partial [Verrucomicrobiales bacterium]
MIAPKDDAKTIRRDQALFPKSKRVYIKGKIHPDIAVPIREVELSVTNHPNGRVEENAPVRIYDTSGPWGDAEFNGNVEEGLPALRRQWILDRGDVEEYDGRDVSPADNGYLSDEHAERYNENKNAVNRLKEYPGL